MPPLPPTPSPVVEIQLHHALDVDNLISSRTFWSYTGGTPSISDLASLNGSVQSLWAAHLASVMSADGLLNGVQSIDLHSSSGAAELTAFTTAGTRSGNVATIGTCAMMLHHISRRYRGGKPRTYFPYGVAADVTSANQWTTGFTGSMQSAWSGFAVALTGVGFGSSTITGQVNVSYFSGFNVVTSPTTGRARNVPKQRAIPVVDAIISSSLRTRIATQRRRINM